MLSSLVGLQCFLRRAKSYQRVAHVHACSHADFYMMDSGLGMIQTSNGVMNSSLYDLITPSSLLAWQRVRVASAVARTGEEWWKTFKMHASGTYVPER